jgi:hypothetical protein
MMVRWLVAVLALAAGPVCAGTDVHIGINVGVPPPPPPVVLEAPPELVVVPSSPVYYAPALPYNVFSYSGHYYLYRDSRWYWAGGWDGPWYSIGIQRVPHYVLNVPVAYYRAPPPGWGRHGRPPWAGGRGHYHGHGYYGHPHGHGKHGHDD